MDHAGPITSNWWFWLGLIGLALAVLALVMVTVRARWLRLVVQILACLVVAWAGAELLLIQEWLLIFGSIQANAWQVLLFILALHAVGIFVLAFVLTTMLSRKVAPRSADRSRR